MNRITQSKGFKLLVTAICILLVLALITAGNSTVGGLFTSFIASPLQRAAVDLTSSISGSTPDPRTREELVEENSILRDENRRLSDMLVNYYDIKKENEELYKFYGIKQENKDFSVVPATVISRDPNENFYGFILDKGTTDGVQPGDPVMTDSGLAGYVCEVSLRSCKVSSILSPAVQIGVVDKKTEDEGVITGDPSYCENGLTLMKNIPADGKIKSGDIVVTSGYGGIYPKNIKIGTVSKLTLDSYTGTPVAVIKPFENVKTISSAAIIIDFSGKGVVEEFSQASDASEVSDTSEASASSEASEGSDASSNVSSEPAD